MHRDAIPAQTMTALALAAADRRSLLPTSTRKRRFAMIPRRGRGGWDWGRRETHRTGLESGVSRSHPPAAAAVVSIQVDRILESVRGGWAPREPSVALSSARAVAATLCRPASLTATFKVLMTAYKVL